MPFKSNNNANPNGRPVGSTNRLTAKAKHYAEKLLDELKRCGVDKVAATGKMSDYVALIRAVLPKDHNVKHTGAIGHIHIDTSKLTREELEQIRQLRRKLTK